MAFKICQNCLLIGLQNFFYKTKNLFCPNSVEFSPNFIETRRDVELGAVVSCARVSVLVTFNVIIYYQVGMSLSIVPSYFLTKNITVSL